MARRSGTALPGRGLSMIIEQGTGPRQDNMPSFLSRNLARVFGDPAPIGRPSSAVPRPKKPGGGSRQRPTCTPGPTSTTWNMRGRAITSSREHMRTLADPERRGRYDRQLRDARARSVVVRQVIVSRPFTEPLSSSRRSSSGDPRTWVTVTQSSFFDELVERALRVFR